MRQQLSVGEHFWRGNAHRWHGRRTGEVRVSPKLLMAQQPLKGELYVTQQAPVAAQN